MWLPVLNYLSGAGKTEIVSPDGQAWRVSVGCLSSFSPSIYCTSTYMYILYRLEPSQESMPGKYWTAAVVCGVTCDSKKILEYILTRIRVPRIPVAVLYILAPLPAPLTT